MVRFVRSKFFGVCLALVLAAITACTANPPPTIALQAGNYTPLGGVQKNNNPTASDFAELSAAESGSLQKPAFVEFYADY